MKGNPAIALYVAHSNWWPEAQSDAGRLCFLSRFRFSIHARSDLQYGPGGFYDEQLDAEPLGSRSGCLCHYRGQLCTMVEPCRRYSRLPSLRAAQGEHPAADSLRQATYWRTLSLSVAGARLSAGDQDQQRYLPASLLLPLRPPPGPH